MIKNRTVQLIFQSFFCAFGLIGIVASLGIFDDVLNPRWDFYVHFTNLSNYLCSGIVFAELVQTAKKEEDSYVTVAPFLKFIGVLAVLLTFLVFNFLLAGRPDRDPQANWRISSISFHIILPVMYILDWILFYEHKNVRWFYPLASVVFAVTNPLSITSTSSAVKAPTTRSSSPFVVIEIYVDVDPLIVPLSR